MRNLLLNTLRTRLPKSLKQGVKKVLGMPAARVHPDWSILTDIGPVDGNHIVLDLGSRNGWFIDCWRDWCPQAQVHAFEPDHPAAQSLIQRFANDQGVTINEVGVGESASTQTFNYFAGSAVSSSFLEPNQALWKKIKYQTGELERREIEVITLDDYVGSRLIDNVYLVKIDIQGYELKALRGSRAMLSHTDYVLVESAIQPLYKGAATFTQVQEFMTEQGFHLMNLRAWHLGDNVLIETDMLFRRNGLEPSLNDELDSARYYIGG